jgi:ribonuclease J
MFEQARLGTASGVPNVVRQKNGDLVRLAPGKPGKFGEVHAGRLVLDGDIIAPADGEAMVMRRRIGGNGIVIVAVDDKGRAKVAGIGLPLDEDYDAFVVEAEADVVAALAKLNGNARTDQAQVTEVARLAARRAATRWSGKRPQVKVMLPVAG